MIGDGLPNAEEVGGDLNRIVADFLEQKKPQGVVLISFKVPERAVDLKPQTIVDVLVSRNLDLNAVARQLRIVADMYETEWLRTVPAREA